jgi:hypothetical protein
MMDSLANDNAPAAPASHIVVSAPAPRNASAGSGTDVAGFKRATPPPLSADRIGATALAMKSEKAENATVPPPPAPAASGNRVMDGLKFVGSLPSKVKSSVTSAAKAERSNSAGSAFSANNVRFDASLARERQSIGRGTGPLYWEISPDGKLIRSSDKTEWHEAYPQEQDLRFKALATSGHEIWAGGSQLTLIHSWNGGVNWQKLKLEDAGSGDITAISIDGGNVQVKTSNGQTFVTQDGGVTWVPLKPNEQK